MCFNNLFMVKLKHKTNILKLWIYFIDGNNG